MNAEHDVIAKAVVKFLTDRGHLTDPMDVFEILTEIRKITETAQAGQSQSVVEASPSHSTATATGLASTTMSAAAAGQQPAVSPKQSIHKDYLICLEDGERVVLLRRHLKSRYNMTPDQYRIKWGLPPDYPMVAPSFAERKSLFAKQTGFGKSHRPEFKEHYDEVKRRLNIGQKRAAKTETQQASVESVEQMEKQDAS